MHMPVIRLSARLLAVTLCLLTLTASAGGRARPFFPADHDARQVPLFEGMAEGVFEVQLVARDEFGGNILIRNTTDQPLTVQLPDAFVGVQVAPQGIGGGFGGGGQGGGGFGGGQGGGQGGQNQSVGGGGAGGQQGGFGGGQGGGGQGGFFSIPPEETLRYAYTSVCLDHGKNDPHPRSNYTIIPVDQYTQDKKLQEFIRLVGSGQLDPAAAQAAAWHLDDGMSWAELAALTYPLFGGSEAQFFTQAQLLSAQQVVAAAVVRAEERNDEAPVEPVPPKTEVTSAITVE